MRPILLKISCVALLAGALTFVGFVAKIPDAIPHTTAESVAVIAHQLNIRNLVSAIYLGPRVVDTFLEVMVVIFAVIGMKYARESIR